LPTIISELFWANEKCETTAKNKPARMAFIYRICRYLDKNEIST
jgi:hypothetical protein